MSEAVKPGYKQTEVGIIPEEWEITCINDICAEISMGPFGSDIKVSNFVSAGVPVLSGANVREYVLSDDFSNFVSKEKSNTLKKAIAHKGDVIVTHRGTIGQVSFIPDDSKYDKYVISQSQFRIRFNKRASPSWMALYFRYGVGNKVLLEGRGHTGVPAIAQATTTFRKLSAPLPPLPEQRAIAATLADVDALLNSLEELLTKKRQLKQAAMQELLTGKTRLEGFEGEWENVTLENVILEISMGPFGSDVKVSNFISYGVPFLSGSNLRKHKLVDNFDNYLSPQKAKSLDKAVARRGDVVITHRGTIGQVSFIPGDSKYSEYVISQSQFRVRLDKRVLPEWIALYFTHGIGNQNLLEGKGHTGVPAIAQPTTTFRKMQVPLPKITEQKAIAAILSEMYAELEALEERVTKTRDLKQGMMQELLTGRTRLL